jgi:hypothetical protein
MERKLEVVVMPPRRRRGQSEAERLQALYAYDVLDSEPELSFDRMTDLVARLFDAPIALISLIDQDRQWFKSCLGLCQRETSNSVSFCKHTLDGDSVLVVPDALQDPRFQDNGLVTGPPYIRFYAGAPLITPGGFNLGSLCVIDTQPRGELSADQRKTLQDLADIVIDELELRRAHKNTERDLRRQAETVVQALELAEDAIAILGADNRFIYLNQAHTQVYGYACSELQGQPLEMLYDPDGVDNYETNVRPHLMQHGTWRGTCTARHRDGTRIEQEVGLSLLPDGGMVRVARDVTLRNATERSQKRLQAELHQAQKLEAIGRLAGGVAHDFNNILAAIEGYAGFLADDLPANGRQAGYAQQILTASERGKTLVQQILSFSRRDPLAMSDLDIAEVVGETSGLLQGALPRRLQLSCDLPTEVLQTRGNQTALSRAIMNLATNARDAVDPAKGRIGIRVRHRAEPLGGARDQVSFDHTLEGVGRVRICELPDGRHRLELGSVDHAGGVAEIAVTDDGVGMRHEMLEHVLEPFYTTKQVGSGTGLGLSAVAGIAISHGGGLTIETAPNRGTAVTLHLPLAAEEAAVPAPAVRSTPDSRSLVLVVDDDQTVADMIGDAIGRLGRQCITCSSPIDALEILERRKAEISCVVTDLMMPEMLGSNLADRVKRTAPEVMVVLCSGRSFLGQQVDNPSIDHVLEKPIRRDALAALFPPPADPVSQHVAGRS